MKITIPLLCAGLVLAALLCLPAAASDNTTIQHTVEIRQAHLAWVALDKEVEMNAAVTYCITLYGADTSGLSRLLAEFRKEEARIPSASTRAGLSTLTEEMRNTTGRFRAELVSVISAKQGNYDDLTREVAEAKLNNPYIQAKKDQYWNIRKANQLADFDAWVSEGQQTLDSLKSRGYDITSAQRALDVFSATRPDVQAALVSRSDTTIDSVNRQIVPLSEAFIGKLIDTEEQVTDLERWNYFIGQGDRVVSEADQLNRALVPLLIDIGDADPVLARTKTDLKTAKNVLNTGNLAATRTPLRLMQKDFTDLAQAYRDIRNSAALPAPIPDELEEMALRLDDTAASMRAVL